jgi:hypothetical protein
VGLFYYIGTNSSDKMKFIPVTEALKRLPFSITRQHIYHLIKAGVLTSGVEYIDIRSVDSKRPTYRVNIERLTEYFNRDPSER